MSIFSTIEVLQRLRKLADVTTNKELATLLSVNEKTLSGWSNRNSMPIETILEAAKKYNCDLNWLLLGESKEQKLDTSERMLLTAFADLNDSQKMQAVIFVGNLSTTNNIQPEKPSLYVGSAASVQNMNAGRDLIHSINSIDDFLPESAKYLSKLQDKLIPSYLQDLIKLKEQLQLPALEDIQKLNKQLDNLNLISKIKKVSLSSINKEKLRSLIDNDNAEEFMRFSNDERLIDPKNKSIVNEIKKMINPYLNRKIPKKIMTGIINLNAIIDLTSKLIDFLLAE